MHNMDGRQAKVTYHSFGDSAMAFDWRMDAPAQY